MKHRLVVTLGTIPSRISSIGPVLNSIKNQTRKPDLIYVCICKFCLRENAGYTVPEWLSGDAEVKVVISEIDYGPATKLLAMLHEETHPDTRIVVVDDDGFYDPALIDVLERKLESQSRSAIGSSGADLMRNFSGIDVRIGSEIASVPRRRYCLTFIAEPPDDVKVDVLQFAFGVLVLRKWFDDDIFSLIDCKKALFFADDLLFSGYMESRGISRQCVSGISLPRILDQAGINSLSGEGRMTKHYKAAIPAISSSLNIWQQYASVFVPGDILYWGWRCLSRLRGFVGRILGW